MGISGHILGERKLRKLRGQTGINFDRAYNRNGEGVGRVIENGVCVMHYSIDFSTYQAVEIADATHWFSCPRGES